MLILGLLHDSKLVILFLDLVHGVCDPLTKGLVLITLDARGRGLDVTMVRPGRTLDLYLLMILVVYDTFTMVHGLVENIYAVFVT